ncbi:hypothetical protein GC167_05295 [bacterium]|nr:hypothetical protein [bacterium]
MIIENQPLLRFHLVEFPFVSVVVKNPSSNDGEEVELNLKIIPSVFYPDNQKHIFKIIQEVNIFSQDHFTIEITAVGTFELVNEGDEKIKKAFVNQNAPAIMFPYIRSFITTLTANLGGTVAPIVIPPQIFSGTLQERSIE